MADHVSRADAQRLRDLVMGARESVGAVLMQHRRTLKSDTAMVGVNVVDAMESVAEAYVALNAAETRLRRRLAGER